jgi:hypothetical protein
MLGGRTTFFEQLSQAVETRLPERAVLRQPVMGGLQATRTQAADTPACVNLALDQPRSFEYAQVTRDGGRRNREGLCQIADVRPAARKSGKDCASRRVGQGSESGVESFDGGRHTCHLTV